MKIVIYIISGIIGIIVLLLIIALFVKKAYVIERKVTINRPKEVVFDYIKYIGNSEKYSKWVMADPNSRRQRIGADGTVGFIYKWDSDRKDVGKGEQEIVKIVEGEASIMKSGLSNLLKAKPMQRCEPNLPKTEQQSLFGHLVAR